MLEDGGVTEIILLGGLDAEGALGPHAQHCLVDVQRAHVLQLGQADVQCTEGTLRTTTGMLSATQEPSLPLVCPAARDHGQGRDTPASTATPGDMQPRSAMGSWDGNAAGGGWTCPLTPKTSTQAVGSPLTCPANASTAVHHNWGSPWVTLETRSQGADCHSLLLLHGPQEVNEGGSRGGDAIVWPAQILEMGHQPPLPGLWGKQRG